MKKTAFIVICIFMLSGGCALSPQTVVINPQLNTVTQSSGTSDIRLGLEVEDPRPSKVIGQRGGVYKTTSDISTDPNMTATLRKKIANSLRNLGYQVVSGNESAQASLRVEITELSYVAHEEELVNSIETRAAVRATCQKGSQEYGSTYRVTHKKEVIKAPSEEKNTELINNVVGLALDKMLADEELLAFIDG